MNWRKLYQHFVAMVMAACCILTTSYASELEVQTVFDHAVTLVSNSDRMDVIDSDSTDFIPKLTLATAEEFAPYAYRGEDGQWKGIDFEIASEVLNRLGIEFKLEAYPRVRMLGLLNNGRVDGLISTTPYEFEKDFNELWKSKPLYESEISVFTLKHHAFDLENFNKASLSNYRIGLLRGFGMDNLLPIEKNTKRVMEVYRDKQLLDLLSVQRIDVALSEDISFIYYARIHNLFERVQYVSELSSRPVSLAISKNIMSEYPALGDRVNEVIQELIQSGFIDQVILRYLGVNDKKNEG